MSDMGKLALHHTPTPMLTDNASPQQRRNCALPAEGLADHFSVLARIGQYRFERVGKGEADRAEWVERSRRNVAFRGTIWQLWSGIVWLLIRNGP